MLIWQPDVIYENLKIHLYTSSEFIDGENTSGFWITCRDKDDNENSSYEDYKKANEKPKREVLLAFTIFDASLTQPTNRSIKNGSRSSNKKCVFPCEYKYTTLDRIGMVL